MAFFAIFAVVFSGCNIPSGPGNSGIIEDKEIEVDYKLPLSSGSGYRGGSYPLADYNLSDISNYISVSVDVQFLDADDNPITGTPPVTDNNDGWGHFFITKEGVEYASGDDGIISGGNGKKYNMPANGTSTLAIPTSATGKPGSLQIETAHATVAKAHIKKITFVAKTESSSNNVVFDWGSGVMTELFPTDTEWPGKSLSLSGASSKTGELGDITQYKEVIVNVVVFDRNNSPVSPGTVLNNKAFFTLTTAEGQWQQTEIVKQYDMEVDGNTSVTPETNKRQLDGVPAWGPGTPTHIVFQGKYESGVSPDKMVGYVNLKSVTFVAK